MANVLFTITFVQAIQAGNTQMLALSKELTLIIVVFKRLEFSSLFYLTHEKAFLTNLDVGYLIYTITPFLLEGGCLKNALFRGKIGLMNLL
ncbi:hypothetical protein M5J17_00745 [Streptococcus koreensis]|uniref:hypothetical protein n=1 Tax=Streptococcus TaxID=1301 RepID=UPI001C5654BE|nr:hypothetical protein [Streptococcus rubneri]QXW97448.1 hypothetical protein LPB404_04365 [Streptococcus rubneri]